MYSYHLLNVAGDRTASPSAVSLSDVGLLMNDPSRPKLVWSSSRLPCQKFESVILFNLVDPAETSETFEL